VSGRWSLLPAVEEDPTVRALVRAELLLDRYGVVTRGSVEAEDVTGGFAAVYRVLARAEEAGRVRRGYFVEGLGASQFATVGAIDRLRAFGREEPAEVWVPGAGAPGLPDARAAVVLAATDPANPYGAALEWPQGDGHRPGRKAGALVALVQGRAVAYLERGGRTALTWTGDPADLAAAARGFAGAVRERHLGLLSVERIDGDPVVAGRQPFAVALREAGFSPTPKGLRLRG
jgi:ATP-dependent Lhr-like helicase